MANLPPILLQELIPPTYEAGALVRLEDYSMPGEGVVEARSAQLKTQSYPGGSEREIQSLGLMDEDLELTGHLRDQWSGSGYQEIMRRALYDLQSRENPIWMTWGETWGRLVVLKTVAFTHVRLGLQYRLVFVSGELEIPPPLITAQISPGAGVLALDDVGTALDDATAITIPGAL